MPHKKTAHAHAHAKDSHEKKEAVKSVIRVRFDVGFSNSLYIRGEGPGLSWMQGVILKNVGPDEWVWETSEPFSSCEFKILINDKQYETGENHFLPLGATVQYTPRF